MVQEKSSSKKGDINQAAIELFACNGFAGTTIKDIALKAGVTEGAIYRHYKSKDEMLATLYARVTENLISYVPAIETEISTRRQVKMAVKVIYDFYEDQPFSLLFLIRNFHVIRPGSAQEDSRGQLYDFIGQYIKSLCGEKKSTPELEVLPSMLSGLILQPIIFHHYQKLPQKPLAYLDYVTGSCCLLLGEPNEH